MTCPPWIRERPVAHRGLHNSECPENSLAAFEAARDAGHPIELDVHASVDGEAVVFHDATLKRMTGVDGRVSQWPWHRLARLRLGGSQQRIPSLAQVFECVDGRVPVIVEVKNDAAVGVVEHAVLRSLAAAGGDCALQSFNPLSLVWFRQEAPSVPRGMLSGTLRDDGLELSALRRVVLRHLMLAPVVAPAYVGYELGALSAFAPSALRKLGVPLLAWTVRTPQQLEQAKQLADNFIFESVAVVGGEPSTSE